MVDATSKIQTSANVTSFDSKELRQIFTKRYVRLQKKLPAIIKMSEQHLRTDINMSFDRINTGGFLQTCSPQLQERIIAETFKTRISRI